MAFRGIQLRSISQQELKAINSYNGFENYNSKITAISPRGQWVKFMQIIACLAIPMSVNAVNIFLADIMTSLTKM